MRGDMGGIHGGDNDAGVSDLRGKASVAVDDGGDLSANRTRRFERSYQIWAYLLFEIAASYGKHENGVFLLQAAHAQPLFENGGPAFVIGAGRQFGNVIGGSV